MNICGYIPESINEGTGLRAVVFISGCRHGCPGCFSPHTWSFQAGEPFTQARQEELLAEMAANPLLDGLTIAGGDPFFSAAEVADFVERVRRRLPHFSIWTYTGYTWEQLFSEPDKYLKLLSVCDVLIDGRFVQELRDVSLRYRGSSNQRLIDVPASLIQQQAIDWKL
ncbi:anaerobic ribonucleoside-triphosphate reductase activating protein [Paenibacillus hunanensis]|uniref:anaerobic ribonucleoside-triphosphate reductase activating protein n=1 Tax=Paenibacillus hunanensis TaxID=539262 RepID=UPI002A6B5767|nr:anaerobic ribonucleoside-triphosphate reductase activating protein [Paenibacillus hunanensis]WPP41090.1 anaerobic ribonucleoside-triphosphate reductase activating protein [Paenibacillus hunanensis]